MRLTAIATTAIVVAGCASTPTTDDDQPLARACSVSECFSENDVRDFEVLDKDTLIVFVGPQRCAFRVDLRGTFCDLTFAPTIAFRTRNERLLEELGRRANDPFPVASSRRQTRGVGQICANDIDVDVEGDISTFADERLPREITGDRYGVTGRRSACQIAGVRSLNDDELLELYVEREVVAPPPPIGPGEIRVGDQARNQEPRSQQTEEAARVGVANTP
jgi:hypothetical protein